MRIQQVLKADLIHHRKALTLFKTFVFDLGDTASCGDSGRRRFLRYGIRVVVFELSAARGCEAKTT